MRKVPVDIIQRLSRNVQTYEQNTDPGLELIVSRPSIPMNDETYLDSTAANQGKTIKDISIAVSNSSRGGKTAYLAYIETSSSNVSAGDLVIRHAPVMPKVSRYSWVDFPVSISDQVIAVDICYGGTIKYLGLEKKRSELMTEDFPWLFWITSSGNLKASKLCSTGLSDRIYDLGSGASVVSAVQSPYNSQNQFNYGLVCFYIVNGDIKYTQYINGEWCTQIDLAPESIPAAIPLPVSTKFVDLSAFRTADYRIGIQVKTTEGAIYEFYTQYMDFGTKGSEHVVLESIAASSSLTNPTPVSVPPEEHVELESAAAQIYIEAMEVLDPTWGEHVELSSAQATASQMEVTIESGSGGEHVELNSAQANAEISPATPV